MTNTIWYHLYVESKIGHKWTLSMKQKQTHKYREKTCGCQGDGGVGERRTESVGFANYYI